MFGFLRKKPVAVLKTSDLAFRKAIANKIPLDAVDYSVNLWSLYPFNFAVAGSRKSCLGNYCYKQNQHYITVNGDSNPFSFLITLIHEIAHQHVTIKYKLKRKKVLPHGQEWKDTFRDLMMPLVTTEVFPIEIKEILHLHMQNPAASSTKDPALVKVLIKHSVGNSSDAIFLESIDSGQIFLFNSKKYKKIETRRTRTLVELVSTRKKYTIASHVEVQILV
jgi:SprT protein